MFVESLEDRRLLSGTVKFLSAMTGAEEVPAIATPGRGTAQFVLSKDGSSLRYKITAKKIDNAMGAHIHVGPSGQVGEIVADLMNSGTMRMARHKFSARGVITAAQLTGSFAGHPLSDLVAQMSAGNAYVNVHTDDGVPPANTAPGDYPDGEIRGVIVQKTRQGTNTQGGGNTVVPPPPMPFPY